MKKFKENTSKLQKFLDWLNASEIDGDREYLIALIRHSALLTIFAVGMFLLAAWILKSSGV